MIAARFPWSAGIALTASFLSGCETTRQSSDGRPMPPPPRASAPPPNEAPINAMAVVLGPKPADTNGNSRPDLIQVEAYLFARPVAAPTWRDGTFEFAIYRPGEAGNPESPGPDPLRRWTFTPEALQMSRSRTLVGESYAVGLSLLENNASDNLGVSSVDLLAIWRPADGGEPVFIQGVRSISLASAAVGPR